MLKVIWNLKVCWNSVCFIIYRCHDYFIILFYRLVIIVINRKEVVRVVITTYTNWLKCTRCFLFQALIFFIIPASIAINLTTTFIAYVFYVEERPFSLLENVLYAGVHRILWALSLTTLMVIDYTTGIGKWYLQYPKCFLCGYSSTNKWSVRLQCHEWQQST